jgi:hypothetical protein
VIWVGVVAWAGTVLGIVSVFLGRRTRRPHVFDPLTAAPCARTCQGAGLPVCLEQGACQVARLQRDTKISPLRHVDGGW